jgi:hypothetical protein
MSGQSSAAVRKAKQAGARPCTSKCNPLHQILPFELFLRAVWPTDSVKRIARVTGKSDRTIKYQLAGELPPSFTDAVAILRSEHGFEFLQHVMGDTKPKWWRGVQKARGLGDMRRQLAEQQRRIAQLEMAID